MTRVAPRRYFVACDSASETAEFGVSRALRPPMHHMVTGRRRCHLGDPGHLGNRSRRGEQPFVLAVEAHGKGIERAAP